MPVGKNPHLRYRIINECLTSKRQRFHSSEYLLKKLADKDMPVQLRCLKADIEAMRNDELLGFHAPIAYCRTNKGYYYTDPNYSTQTIPLTDEDFKGLNFAIDILQRYVGVSAVKHFEEAIDKVVKVTNQLKSDKVKSHSRVIAFEKAPYYKGLEYFDRIENAIRDQQPLAILYKKFGSEKELKHTFHPYFLKEYKDRWYVLGYSKERHFTLPLGLDRMESIADAPIPYKQNKTIDADTYFKHILGITVAKGPVEDIRLWFSPTQAPYIKTRNIHHSQETISDGVDGLVISLQLIPNYELLQEILSYGPEVKVMEPESLREKVKEMLEKAGKLY
jgi:predicted DNA-binding transcriptional regulator YafY